MLIYLILNNYNVYRSDCVAVNWVKVGQIG